MLSDGHSRDKTWTLILAVVAAAVLVPTGVNAAVDAFRLQDGNGQSKAQVDNGTLRVGDGDGPMTVNGAVDADVVGKVSSSDSELLAFGDCESSSYPQRIQTGSVPTGTTITDIVLTNDIAGGALTTLIVKKPSIDGYVADPTTDTERAGGRFMALQVGWQSGGYAHFNDSVNFGDGVKIDEPWHFFCSGVIGSSQGNGLWSVYGYEN